jgi:hypothetical protein
VLAYACFSFADEVFLKLCMLPPSARFCLPSACTGRKGLGGSGSISSSSDGGLEAIVAAAKQRKASGQAAGDEFSIDLSKLSLEQLERLREKAREKQWEDEWWNSYVKQETDKKVAQDKESKQKDKQTISQYNITITRYVQCWTCTAGHVLLGMYCSTAAMVADVCTSCSSRSRRNCSLSSGVGSQALPYRTWLDSSRV